jgi:DNA/RNA-binding domain of Phe-tRNA-synthetase-like protein
MLTLRFEPDLTEQIPFLRMAGLLFEGVSGGPSPAPLLSLMESAVAQTAAGLQLEEISGLPGVAGWRRVLKALGTDPARYRVSSERLLRRTVKGDGLPQVNALVDICNVWSLVTGLPAGLYDADRMAGDVLVFGAGRPGESYQTLAGAILETAGKPVLRDAEGPCGSPLTDSERTKTDEATRRCVLVVFVPPGYDPEELERHLALAADWYPRYAGGRLVQRQVALGLTVPQ